MLPKFKRKSFSFRAFEYAQKVIDGRIDASWQVRAQCQRSLALFDRPDIAYDEARVDHFCEFGQALPHVIGPLAGECFCFEPWQLFLFANIFGFIVKATGLRLHREVFALLPRGSAKSTVAAIIGNYMAFCEGEGGAQVLSGATSMDQAMHVFEPARQMALQTPAMCEALGLEVNARSIYQISSGSSFKPVIAKTKDGGLPWCAIADELHQALDGTQLQAFRTGMGKRRGSDPLLLIISTAGVNLAGICRSEQLYFESVLNGSVRDDAKFALIYTIDLGTDDWKDLKVWKKANPNYGVSVDETHLKGEYEKALQSPAAQADALTKYLNVWCNTAAGWLNQADWSRAAQPSLEIPPGVEVSIGVDMSTKTDLTAITVGWTMPDGRHAFVSYLFVPSGALERNRNSTAYADWIASGHLIQTEGTASDHAAVRDKLKELLKTYRVQVIHYDEWEANTIMQELAADGANVVAFSLKAPIIGPAMDDFEADLQNRLIVHPDNPCLNWQAQNISVQPQGKFKRPSKPTGQDHLRIDGMVTVILAHAGLRVAAPEPLDLTLEWFD
ncbi:Phage terminase-like protein, large subunit, contains N-terminal HTH domain [Sphingomonas guangdongensis]|uniref:Phage terminase-like protein, large subunit, contains N-terminal HTH domain n=1 Tax=Sphingomonas guangdongensis TaxID=1141890 RepID=A0A285QZF1_9SPHN|nr:terminase TerL endonuclease subunit [Sphingomonas guangdongensis]SOB86759.1 Phage terminase-like protein, large subunit, contains N-terminal HTH domain [Sphingomonas guangdongensis]